MLPHTERSRKKATGYIMAGVGLVLILVNAADYVFDLGRQPVVLMIIGLVMVVTGMNVVKNRR